MSKNINIALDLDKTLFTYESKWKAQRIGEPIPEMVENVKKWLNKGYSVTLFTARVARDDWYEILKQEKMILEALEKAGLPVLPITAIKFPQFTHFIDDKAFHSVPNIGQIVNAPLELL